MTLHVTPEYITSLKPNEFFVFGSNLAGGDGGMHQLQRKKQPITNVK